MAINILELLTEALGGQIAKQASEFLGEPENNTKSALGMVLPALLGSLAKQGSTVEGAGSLLKTLGGANIDSGILGNIAGLFSEKSKTDSLVSLGTTLVGSLFGEKAGSIASTIASLTGLKSSSSSNLLALAAPLVFSFLKKLVSDKGLDAGGLMGLLAEQTGFLKGKVNPQLAGAMGLGSMFDSLTVGDASAAAAPTAAPSRPAERPTYAPPVAAEERSGLSKLLPWLIGLGALLGGLALFRGCDKEAGAPENKAVVAPAVKAPAPQAAAPAVKPAPAPVPAAPAAPAAKPAPAPAAAATAVLPAKIYFAVGAPNPEGPSIATLAQAAIAVKNQGVAVDITGYTDSTGDVAKNQELAKQRALAVRDRLIAAGVPEGKINMKPPFSITTTGTGSDAEARRVEITLAK
jgi:outer membrane protein OmpA-like peptidoglycan-associated protein